MYRLHTGLRNAGVSSSVLVENRVRDDPDVYQLPNRRSLIRRIRRRLRWERMRTARAPYLSALHGQTFSSDRSVYGGELVTSLPPHDLVNLHWVAGFVDYHGFFTQLSRSIPIVWTLHDMNPFTGGCHYDDGCGRFDSRCGSCPMLQSLEDDDLSRQTWLRKLRALSRIRREQMHVVCPSSWLAREVCQSSLMAAFQVSVIPNGADTNMFSPHDRTHARESTGIPQDKIVVLFVGASRDVPRKGLRLLLHALEQLENRERYCLVTVGSGCTNLAPAIRTIEFGSITNDATLAALYSAADLLALPSLNDNLPNTGIEALACGTPVVGHGVGGIPEIVRPRQSGAIVDCNDPTAFARAIEQVGLHKEAYSDSCRRIAITEYSVSIQTRRYAGLYADMLAVSAGK